MYLEGYRYVSLMNSRTLCILTDFDYFNFYFQTDEDPPHAYSQTFVLKPVGTSFYIQHDIFRLALHDSL